MLFQMKYKNFNYHYECNTKNKKDILISILKSLPSVTFSVTVDDELGDKTGSSDLFYIDVNSNYDSFKIVHDAVNEKKIICSFSHYEDEFLEHLTYKLLSYLNNMFPDYNFSHNQYTELLITNNKELTVQTISMDFEYLTDVFEKEILNPEQNMTSEFKEYICKIINQIKTNYGI